MMKVRNRKEIKPRLMKFSIRMFKPMRNNLMINLMKMMSNLVKMITILMKIISNPMKMMTKPMKLMTKPMKERMIKLN